MGPQRSSNMASQTTSLFISAANVCISLRGRSPDVQQRCTNFFTQNIGPRVVSKKAARIAISPPTYVRASASSDVVSISELESSVLDFVETARKSIETAETLKDVDSIRVTYLGKKGSITTVMKSIGKLPPDDRPRLGSIVNKAKDEVMALINQRKEEFEQAQNEVIDEEWIDVDMPSIRSHPTIGRMHPLTSTMEIATEIFRDIGYDVIDDPEYNREIETDYYCFEALNCPPDHPARDMQDTFYLKQDKSVLLRTQTSSVQIRYMEKNKPPFKIIAPGRVYRRDSIDATHSPVFHQVEILAVDKSGVLSVGSLRATVIHFLKHMLGENIETRFRASYFPFTEPSMEVDVFFRGKWLEVLGCGMVDPEVLKAVGLDPNEWTGFAAGFGVERFAMVMHEIPDIREFYKNDPRFLSQFMTTTDLVFKERYRPTEYIDPNSAHKLMADDDRVVHHNFDEDEQSEGQANDNDVH